jgi:hypothetical protein
MPGDFFSSSSFSKIKTALDFPARTGRIQGAHKQNVNMGEYRYLSGTTA